MKNKNVKGILALVLVTALSFGVIAGSNALAKDMTGTGEASDAAVTEELDVSGATNIDKAAKTENGYVVTAREKGYGGDVVLNVSFDSSTSKVTKLEVAEHNETESLGANIAEDDFLSQFNGISAPVYLPGMTVSEDGTAEAPADNSPNLEVLEGAALTDGSYTAKGEPDSNGFTEEVNLTVADGKITEVNWDAIMEDGTRKSVMSENGQYTMTEDGLTWKAQAEALAAALIENQTLSFLTTNEEGKTDAVSGVSIAVGSFIDLSAQCLAQSAGVTLESEETPAEDTGSANGTQIDAVSGATVSSTAVVNAINNAYQFLKSVQ